MILFGSYFPEQDVLYMNSGMYEIDVRSQNYNIIKDISCTSMIFYVKQRDIDLALKMRMFTNYGIETNIFITDKVEDQSAVLYKCSTDTDLNIHVHFCCPKLATPC